MFHFLGKKVKVFSGVLMILASFFFIYVHSERRQPSKAFKEENAVLDGFVGSFIPQIITELERQSRIENACGFSSSFRVLVCFIQHLT